jgi:hypothetical protein
MLSKLYDIETKLNYNDTHTKLILLLKKQRRAPAWRAQPNDAGAVENDQSRLTHAMHTQYDSTLH